MTVGHNNHDSIVSEQNDYATALIFFDLLASLDPMLLLHSQKKDSFPPLSPDACTLRIIILVMQ